MDYEGLSVEFDQVEITAEAGVFIVLQTLLQARVAVRTRAFFPMISCSIEGLIWSFKIRYFRCIPPPESFLFAFCYLASIYQLFQPERLLIVIILLKFAHISWF